MTDPLFDDWHVIARSADIEEGKVAGARLLGEDLVVWRSGGKAQVWLDVCVHRGTRLSMGWVDDCEIVCPYHGWRYNTEGKCTRIPAHPDQPPPAKARAATYPVREQYGFIWTCLGTPTQDLPPFPEWDDPAFRKEHAGPYPFLASGFRAVENFIDASHFPFVHAGFNGDPRNPDRLEEYTVAFDEHGLVTGPVHVRQFYGDHRGVPVDAAYTYHVFRPLTAYFSKDTGGGNRFCTFLTATPIDHAECIVWLCVAINFGDHLTVAQIRARQDLIFGQDRRIVESQRPERIPLDLHEELHVRSDKLAVEYRKWLKQLGVTIGAM
jgi:phenylpropionate dioxygenase-like ring-hydroxylating dioxygenase large terminal subunit